MIYMMDEVRIFSAYGLFYREYLKSAKRNNRLEEADFAKEYLSDRSTDKAKHKYLKKVLPQLPKEEREQYLGLIYRCRFCNKYFPIWYVSDAEWAETGGAFERLITIQATGSGIIPGDDAPLPCVEVVLDAESNQYYYRPADTAEIDQTTNKKHEHEHLWGLFICRECYEKIFNPEPNYIDIEQFERELPAESWKCKPPQGYFDWKKKRFSVVWDLPASKVPA
jgi:hypothetical protein